MSSDPTVVTPDLLREWGLPSGGDSKASRGDVVVVGGAARSPGAAMLSGVAALRVGAGRLTLAVDETVATAVAVAVPECGVAPLGGDLSAAADDLGSADVVVLGPGLDDIELTEAFLDALAQHLSPDAAVVLDAYALGALSRRPELRDPLPQHVVLTPNHEEAARLLGRDLDADGAGSAEDADDVRDARDLAERYRAIVSCYGVVAAPSGEVWRIGTGASGLGTSGSGDVLAGAIAGFCARGVDPARATVWGTHVHAVAGDRLAVQVGPLGYLAGELLTELPRVLVEVAPALAPPHQRGAGRPGRSGEPACDLGVGHPYATDHHIRA